MIVGGRTLAAIDVTLDPVVVTQHDGTMTYESAGGPIVGQGGPLIPKSWWPWLLLIGAGLAIWWAASSEDEDEGEGEGPFLGG